MKTGTFSNLESPLILDNMKNTVKIVPTYDKEFVEIYTSHDGKLTFKSLKKGITTIMVQLVDTYSDEIVATRSFIVDIRDKIKN